MVKDEIFKAIQKSLKIFIFKIFRLYDSTVFESENVVSWLAT